MLFTDDWNAHMYQLRWLKGWSHMLRSSWGMRAGRKPLLPCGCWAVLCSQFCSGTRLCQVCRLSGSVPGRWKGAATCSRKQPGVVCSWERGLEGLCKVMGRKRSASLEERLLFKKILQEVTAQQTWAESFQRNYRPSSTLQGLIWQTDGLTSTGFLGHASFLVCLGQYFKTWLPSFRYIQSWWCLTETGWWPHLVTTA